MSPKFLSKSIYVVMNQWSFLVLDDQSTIIGIRDKGNHYVVQKENMGEELEPVEFEGKMTHVNTLLVNESDDILMTGEDNKSEGRVVQYVLSKGTIKKDYGPVDVGKVLCSKRIDNLCFFGGMNGSVRVIDTKKQEIVCDPIETCIGDIYQLEICLVEEDKTKVMLAVGGRDMDHSDMSEIKSDYFDVTGLVKKVSIKRLSNHKERNFEL